MASSAELIWNFRSPAILSYGFRLFFLFGAIWAAFVMALWPDVVAGLITLPTAFDPIALARARADLRVRARHRG